MLFYEFICNNYWKIILIYKIQVMFQTELKEILIKISEIEYKLENYRQLLNQEIQFNLKDLYVSVCKDSTITAYHLQQYIDSFPIQMNEYSDGQMEQSINGEETTDNRIQELQSVIKGYNNCSSLNLTFIQFSLLFLSKQNHLLAKLTLQRKSIGNLPFYLRNYARRILLLECQLHKILIVFRKNYSSEMEMWIKEHTILNEKNQKEFDTTILQSYCSELGIQHGLIVANFKILPKQNIKYDRMVSLFTLKNCQNVRKVIQKKMKQNNQFGKNPSNPYVRPEFNDCLNRNDPPIEQISNFSYRQLRSIQKHMQRIQLKSPSKINLTQKISSYCKKVQKQLKVFCKALKKIIEQERQLEYHRVQLALCTDFYPILFFNSFQKDFQKSDKEFILPSTFKEYLANFGIPIQLSDLFLLFKRFSNRADGKLAFNQFCSIFDLTEINRKYYSNIQKNREVVSLADVDLTTKKLYLSVIKNTVRIQKNIQKIKHKLNYPKQAANAVDFREIFSCIDQDEDGFASQIDFKIAFRKFLNVSLSQEEIGLFWHRARIYENFSENGSLNSPNIQILQKKETSCSQMMAYQKFIVEMNSKSKLKKVKRDEQKTNSFTKTIPRSPKSSAIGSKLTIKH